MTIEDGESIAVKTNYEEGEGQQAMSRILTQRPARLRAFCEAGGRKARKVIIRIRLCALCDLA